MNRFRLILRDSTHSQSIDGVISFVGEDDSGSFGIKARHTRMMTSLVFGLARFNTAADNWQYLALPGAILYFADNVLMLNTRRYLISDDYERITQALLDTLATEEEELATMKRNLRDIEAQVLKRLMEVRRNW